MATRIRLQRHGKKGKPFYHIVVADSRSKRDGRFIEKLGTYNPNTNPATVELDFDRSVHWVGVGASPSDTAKAILSYRGVLMKEHLMRGVAKGALTEEQMEAKFNQWMEQKAGIIENKVSGLAKAKAEADKARLAAETEVKEARAAAIVAANTPPEEEVSEAADGEGETATESAEAPAEAASTDEASVVETEAPAEEAKSEEAPAEEAKSEEAPATETPAEEAKTEEAPAAEETQEEDKKDA